MKQFSHVNCRVFSFANRCSDVWNSLSDDVVCAPSVPVFKYRLKLVELHQQHIFTELYGMQTRYRDKNSVCLSVRLSVCHMSAM